MALEPCRECGENVSAQAPKCPHCGVPWPSKKTVAQNRIGAGLLSIGCLVWLALTLGFCTLVL